jgi:hypothetical protein
MGFQGGWRCELELEKTSAGTEARNFAQHQGGRGHWMAAVGWAEQARNQRQGTLRVRVAKGRRHRSGSADDQEVS